MRRLYNRSINRCKRSKLRSRQIARSDDQKLSLITIKSASKLSDLGFLLEGGGGGRYSFLSLPPTKTRTRELARRLTYIGEKITSLAGKRNDRDREKSKCLFRRKSKSAFSDQSQYALEHFATFAWDLQIFRKRG